MFAGTERASRGYTTHPRTFSPEPLRFSDISTIGTWCQKFRTGTGVPWVSYFPVGKISSGLSTIVYADRSIFVTLLYTYNVFIVLSLIYEENPCSVTESACNRFTIINSSIDMCFILIRDKPQTHAKKNISKYYFGYEWLLNRITSFF